MNYQYDFLIVGAGLFGSVCARELTDKGFKCLVIEKKDHIAGNCFTENVNGINVHKYGPHIFHTSNEDLWKYVNRFASFNNYVNRPKVNYKNNLYSFPLNLFSLYQIYGVTSPREAKAKLESVKENIANPSNLEEWVLSQVGREIYETFIYGYTKKQWGREPKDLPASIIKRLPIRLSFDDNYFFDKYQGIPEGGYTKLFQNLLEGIEVRLNVDYFSEKNYFNGLAKTVIYTGPVDLFYDFCFGKLDYRSLKFESELLPVEDYQGNAIINYTEYDVPYTRIVEHKHFEKTNSDFTIITKEYPATEGDPYYPINDSKNSETYLKYKNNADAETNVVFGGRLAEYKYFDMHQVVASALHQCKKITK